MLLFASAGVFHHAGIKIPFFAFFAHDSGIRCKEAPRNMLVAMGIAAAFCMFNGMFPNALLYRLLPYEVHYVPYTLDPRDQPAVAVLLGAGCFVWLKLSGLYPPELRSVNLDSDWFYRRSCCLPRRHGLPRAAGTAFRAIERMGLAERALARRLRRSRSGVYRHHGPEGVLARSWYHRCSSVIWVCDPAAATA